MLGAPEPGQRVTFADGGLVVHGRESVSSGIVNGPCVWEGDEWTHVSVFAKRDGGREATTIYVARANVLSTSDDVV